MDWDKWKTRFGQDSIKVFLGAAVISAIGLGAYAVLQEPPALPDGDVVSVTAEEFEEVKGVKLIPADPELPARTTFRVHFDNSIIKPEQVDQAGQMNPLVFEPPLKGKFIWDSTRSGAFTPDSGFVLDARITVSLREVIAKQTGLQFRRQYHTPPMQVEAHRLNSLNSDRAFSAAMAFNVAMNAESAEDFVQFQAANGKLISASIEPNSS